MYNVGFIVFDDEKIVSVVGVSVAGLILSVALALWGRPLLSLKAEWASYASLAPHMVALAINGTIGMACLCMTTARMARSRFGFLWYCLPLTLGKSLFLYALTGYTFFVGIVPESWIKALEAFNPCRLSVVICIMIVSSVVTSVVLWREVAAEK